MRMTITELVQGTSQPLSKSMTVYGWEEENTFVTVCSENQHGLWNVESWESCSAEIKPGWHTTMVYRCNFIYDENDNGDGADGEGGSQQPGDGNTAPNTNIGIDGCSGIPTIPKRMRTPTPN